MGVLIIAMVIGGTFGLCFLVDKGFTKIFRGKEQHRSGRSIRLNPRYGAFGLILIVLGLGAVFAGMKDNKALAIGGGAVIVIGICLVVYYMTFGVFYDDDSFILTTFGKKSQTYQYRDIVCQQLYNSYGSIVIELVLKDERSVHLQAGMSGVYPFMDAAFSGWCRQKGIDPENCAFYNPGNSCWFPTREDT